MISCRSDLFRQLKPIEDPNAQNPVGKNFMLVPNTLGVETEQRTITRVESRRGLKTAVYYRRPNGEEQVESVERFLGCRDGYAFFQSIEFPNMIGNPLITISDNETQGTIVSIDKGIFKTDTGKEFKAEENDSQMDDEYPDFIYI